MRFRIAHRTRYAYAAPVTFGEHRLMLRPRDSHEIRLLDARLTTDPAAELRWVYDTFGNSVAYARFAAPADHLDIESMLTVEHFGLSGPALPVEDRAARLPFSYTPEERADLGRLLDRHTSDAGRIAAWAYEIVARTNQADTMAVLDGMMARVRRELRYQARDAEGVQSPVETLNAGSGSCRDFAYLMMEAARSVGIAARFVSGYLYDPALDRGPGQTIGGGSTHAWLQVFLPGAGWISFDPTNGHVEGQSRIPVAIAREPWQTSPISGSFSGQLPAAPTLTVNVSVTTLPEAPQAAPRPDPRKAARGATA